MAEEALRRASVSDALTAAAGGDESVGPGRHDHGLASSLVSPVQISAAGSSGGGDSAQCVVLAHSALCMSLPAEQPCSQFRVVQLEQVAVMTEVGEMRVMEPTGSVGGAPYGVSSCLSASAVASGDGLFPPLSRDDVGFGDYGAGLSSLGSTLAVVKLLSVGVGL